MERNDVAERTKRSAKKFIGEQAGRRGCEQILTSLECGHLSATE